MASRQQVASMQAADSKQADKQAKGLRATAHVQGARNTCAQDARSTNKGEAARRACRGPAANMQCIFTQRTHVTAFPYFQVEGVQIDVSQYCTVPKPKTKSVFFWRFAGPGPFRWKTT